jgi:hypothetical protein
VGRISRAVTIAAVVAVGIATVGALAPSAWATPVTLSLASAATATITPGATLLAQLDARTASECTADFVFSSGSALYIGFSAHCTAASDAENASGCSASTLPLGTPIEIRGRNGREEQGRLAYNSWRTMQQRGETTAALCSYNDFALVALDPAETDAVNPSMPVLGGPTGLDTDGLTTGEDVYSFQPNNGGSGVKSGVAVSDAGGGRSHRVAITPPGVPGDSGSGFLDAQGRAVGVLSTEFFDARHTNGVTDLALALAYANSYGDLGRLTLVPGTEPFRGGIA